MKPDDDNEKLEDRSEPFSERAERQSPASSYQAREILAAFRTWAPQVEEPEREE